MQALRTELQPVPRNGGGVFREDRRGLHVALLQTHAMAVLDVDRGNDLHGGGRGSDGRRRAEGAGAAAAEAAWN